jgi:sugar phosphate isomerase/epimerase
MGRFKVGVLEDVLKADWSEVFPKARALGYDGVELGVRADDYLDTELWSEDGLQKLRQRSEETAVPIFSICLHTFWTYTFADPDVSKRTTAKQIVMQALRACKSLGVPAMLIPVTNPLGLPAEESAQRWADETKGIAAEAARYGVKIGLENVGRSHIVTGEQMLELIQTVDNPSVGTYFDVGNAQMLGSDSIADIHTLKDHIVQVHIKDPRKDRKPCYVGEGEIDLQGCLKALVEVDYTGPLVFETPGMDDPLDTADRNLKTLQALIETVGAS